MALARGTPAGSVSRSMAMWLSLILASLAGGRPWGASDGRAGSAQNSGAGGGPRRRDARRAGGTPTGTAAPGGASCRMRARRYRAAFGPAAAASGSRPTSGFHGCLRPPQARRSWLAPAGARVGGGEPDGRLDPVKQFLAQPWRHQHARLELEHARVEGGEDGPDTRLVQPLHDELGATGVGELEPHHQAVLADPGEPLGNERLDPLKPAPQQGGDVVHHRPDLGPAGDLQRLQRGDAAELGAAEG